MAAVERFAKGVSRVVPVASSRSAASTCMRSIISPSNRSAPPVAAATSRSARAISSVGRGEGRVARRDLAGVDQALAVEPEHPALRRFRGEALQVVELVEDAVEHRDAVRPARPARSICSAICSGSRPAPRGRRRSARKVVGPGDQRRRLRGRSSAAASTPLAVSIIASTGMPRLVADEAKLLLGLDPRHDHQRPACRCITATEVRRRAIRCATPLTRIATGIGQSARPAPRPPRRAPTPCPPASPHPRGRG